MDLESAARLRRELPTSLQTSAPTDNLRAHYLAFYSLPAADEKAGVSHEWGRLHSGEFELVVQRWRPARVRGRLLIVHGYFDHLGLYGHLIRYGLGRGLEVVGFDLPGHGLSSGARAAISDFGDYTQALRDVLVFADAESDTQLLGQSTGAAIIMDFLTRQPAANIDRAILLAPLVRPAGWGWVSFAHGLVRHFRDSVPRRFAENSNDAEFLHFLKHDPLQPRAIAVSWVGALKQWLPKFLRREPVPTPVLVLQGDADEAVDWRFNLPQVQRLFPSSQVEVLPGGRHHLANESTSIRSAMLQRVDQFLEP